MTTWHHVECVCVSLKTVVLIETHLRQQTQCCGIFKGPGRGSRHPVRSLNRHRCYCKFMLIGCILLPIIGCIARSHCQPSLTATPLKVLPWTATAVRGLHECACVRVTCCGGKIEPLHKHNGRSARHVGLSLCRRLSKSFQVGEW